MLGIQFISMALPSPFRPAHRSPFQLHNTNNHIKEGRHGLVYLWLNRLHPILAQFSLPKLWLCQHLGLMPPVVLHADSNTRVVYGNSWYSIPTPPIPQVVNFGLFISALYQSQRWWTITTSPISDPSVSLRTEMPVPI